MAENTGFSSIRGTKEFICRVRLRSPSQEQDAIQKLSRRECARRNRILVCRCKVRDRPGFEDHTVSSDRLGKFSILFDFSTTS